MNKLVVFFNDSPVYPTGINAGGGESATLALAKAIAACGWHVIACGNLPDGETKVDGIDFWNFGSNYRIDQIAKRLNTIGDFHCLASTIAHPFLFLQDHKNCLTRSIFNHSPSESASGLDLLTVFRLIDVMMCVSEAQRDIIIEKSNERVNVKVVKNGFDPKIFEYQGPEGRDFNHVIFVGRVEVWKGAHLLIDSFPSLKKRFPQFKMSMFGEFSTWEPMLKIKQKIESDYPDLRLRGKVSQKEIAKELRTAGLLVFPSISFESAGLAVVDAQASGCPVLAFDTGGVKEYLFDGQCGILQVDQSLPALIHSLTELLSHPELLAKFSSNCLLKARERTWDVVAKDVIQTLLEIQSKSSQSNSQSHALLEIPEFNRILNFSNFSVDRLLSDHQTVSEGKAITTEILDSAEKSGIVNSGVFLCRAMLLEKSGHKNEAIKYYQQAANNAQAKDWQPYFCLTLLLAEVGDLRSAGANAKEVLMRTPTFPMKSMLNQIIEASGIQ